MAVPFYVPSDGGNGPSTSDSATNSEGSATAGTNPGVAPTPQNAPIPHDPLLGALCEALYRVLLARQGQAGAPTLPPPSPTCSPYQFSPQPTTDVFFPNGSTVSPPQSPSDHNTTPTLNYRHNEPLTPRSAQEFVFGNAGRIEQALSNRHHDNDTLEVRSRDEFQRRREEEYEFRATNEELTVFNGTVPLQRRRKATNKVNERGKDGLSWPVVTAVLVAVGCGILRATR